MSRFDYIKYDSISIDLQQDLKLMYEGIEKQIEILPEGRAKSLILTHLEISYMWTGKAIRDAQVSREGKSKEQPERGE